jgi:hypothetical protein
MSPETPVVQSLRGHLRRSGSRLPAARKRSRRRVALEGLEPRTLLATLPAATILNRVDVSNGTGDESTPSIAINPANPQILAAAWVRNDPSRGGGNTVLVEAAFSTNGGASWSSLARPGIPPDPTVTPTGTGAVLTTFRVGFPTQQLNGTYTIELGPDILSSAGEPLDTNRNAGVDILRGSSATVTPGAVTVPSTNVPLPVPPGQTVSSVLDVPGTSNFVIQDVTRP